MRIAVIGGGPGGLYFAALAKQLGADHEITVWERNRADDTFGFGVVFSDETLGGIEHADPAIHAKMAAEFAIWDDIDVHFRGQVITSGGHGFAAMSRRRLLEILQARCRELGVQLHFETEAPPVEELAASYDLVIAGDGLNSRVRSTYAETYRPSVETRRCRYMWLGTSKVFDAFTFVVRETEYGVMQIHGYPYDATGSTFIIEMHDDVWERAGFAELAPADLAPGESDEKSIARVCELFADVLRRSGTRSSRTTRSGSASGPSATRPGDTRTSCSSATPPTPRTSRSAPAPSWRWRTRLALAACLHEEPSLDEALAAYETERRPVVLSTQRAAQASLEWFENLGQYVDQEPMQFAFNIMTRSRRVTYDNLRVRDHEFVERADAWFADHERRRGIAPGDVRPPMFQPFRLRGLTLPNRVIVSAMDMYMADDGVPGDFHFTHLTGKALGGAGLVMTEMTCVSPEGRITPACCGLYDDAQTQAFRRIVDFVHEQTPAAIGLQLGHSGRKGSTKRMWEGMDQPLPDGNWEVVGPSPLAYLPGVNQVPRELTHADLAEIRQQFVDSARRGIEAGFDLIELHCAHGYLLSSFISPLTNQRTDEYGGSLENRLRFPVEVFSAIREVWPQDRPMTVRISATDWMPGGIEVEDAVQVAAAFAAAGADAIDVSTGQVSPEERPDFGRSYQTPFADAIRNRVDIATIAVGAISSYDDVNSLILAGRADLCALGRVHLYDPMWTLHAALDQDYDGPGVHWPDPWLPGRRKPQTGRTDGPRPRLTLVRDLAAGRDASAVRHRRWHP